MIKHVSSNNILSNYNPIISLKPRIKEIVNQKFFKLIAEYFFEENKNLVEILDIDKLKTEIDFDRDKNFVNEYIYKEIIDEIIKNDEGVVEFKPKYVFTLDKDLTPYHSKSKYPYKSIFNYSNKISLDEIEISYGKMVLGNEPILYYIWFDIQVLIQFIKTIEITYEAILAPKFTSKTNSKTKIAIQNEIRIVRNELHLTNNEIRKIALREQLELLKIAEKKPELDFFGKSGNLRINLSWETIDDLDLHVVDPDENIICYKQTTAIAFNCKGELDIDANASVGTIDPPPQENVYWEQAPDGKYKVKVQLFSKRENIEKIEFTIRIVSTNKDQLIYRWYLTNEKEFCDIVAFEYNELQGIHNINKLF